MYASFKEMEVEKWKKHFALMAEGKVRPNHKGHYVVEDKQVGSGSREPEIKFVTPIAQAVELAKSELKDYNGPSSCLNKKGYKRTSTAQTKQSVKKHKVIDHVFTNNRNQ